MSYATPDATNVSSSLSYPRTQMQPHPLSIFFFSSYGDHRDLHSFPTRRSSDLELPVSDQLDLLAFRRGVQTPRTKLYLRSEEHTSELQSQFHLVCRLLLEKKKPETCSIRDQGQRWRLSAGSATCSTEERQARSS